MIVLSPRKVLRYILEKPSAEYLGGNMAATTPRLLAKEFREIANHNHSVQKPVVHISLSPSPTEELPDRIVLDLVQAYMEKIGFSDCQWILVTNIQILKQNLDYHAHTSTLWLIELDRLIIR